ncbi:MAG: glycosyltransferase [Clostridia bacterium]|nr:glycosyltransferase [Clostridia bacterium]
MEPTLSVIVPVYNTEKYLAECVQSILDQTYRDYEIILVDDGSSDASSEICDGFALKYDFITAVHPEHSGVVNARKSGLAASKGKYISYIDSDDIIYPDMYEHMMGKIKEYDADICICGMIIEYKKENIYTNCLLKPGIYDKEALEKDCYPKMLFDIEKNNPAVNPSLGNKIIRKELLIKNLTAVNEKIAYGEDAMCTYPCLLDAEKVYVADNKLFYRYRQVYTSISHIYDPKLLSKFALLVEELGKAFKERGFDIKDQLSWYAARHSTECIRKELLYNKNESVGKRIKNVDDYLKKPEIHDAFQKSRSRSFDKSTDIKIRLASKHKIFRLYILFSLRNMFSKFKGF